MIKSVIKNKSGWSAADLLTFASSPKMPFDRRGNLLDFWIEYTFAARKSFTVDRLADGDPLLSAFYDWFRKIDAATARAEAEGFCYFSCGRVDRGKRIALRFRKVDGQCFVRTLAINAKVSRDGSPLKLSEILDIQIGIQSLIVGEGRVKPDPKAGWISLS